MTMSYDAFLSRAAEAMQQSPIRQMGTIAATRADLISFAPGYPGPDSFAWDDYRAIADRLLRERGADLLQYGPTHGLRPLLEAFLELLAGRGITVPLDNLLVTTGSQQGLDLVARTLLDPGDVVLLELPSYTGAIAAFRNVQATLAGVRQHADGNGIDTDDLQLVLQRHRRDGRKVKFLYIVPNFQNPTGSLLSQAKRRWLLDWAAREHLLIVEDDPYNDLYFEDVASGADTRPIKADDRDGRVIYLSSLSKTLAPAFRTAWVTAPAPYIAKLDVAKQAGDLCSSSFDQRIAYEAIRGGVLARRIPELRRYYQQKRTAMEQALRRELDGIVTWPAPRGGFFLWASLPPDLDSQTVLARALEQGVIFVVGSAFFVDGSGRQFMRLAFSLPGVAQIDEGVTRLGAAIKPLVAPVSPSPLAAALPQASRSADTASRDR
jgi:2-aminoadipate transaminase